MNPDLAWAVWCSERQRRIEDVLEKALPGANRVPVALSRAMRYAVLDGGKRMRPLLAYAAGEVAAAPPKSVDAVAAAVELVLRKLRADAREIDRLPPRHAEHARSIGQHRARRVSVPGRACRRLCACERAPAFGQHTERERLQRIAGEQRGRFTKRDVTRRLAAAQRVIVHARKIVVDERIGVDELHRGGD